MVILFPTPPRPVSPQTLSPLQALRLLYDLHAAHVSAFDPIWEDALSEAAAAIEAATGVRS